jgi:hypothetical protein
MPEATSAMFRWERRRRNFDFLIRMLSWFRQNLKLEIGDFKGPQGPEGFHTIAGIGTSNFNALPPYFFST